MTGTPDDARRAAVRPYRRQKEARTERVDAPTSPLIWALKTWGPAAVWAAVLFLLSETSGGPSQELFPYDDKAAHFVLYGVMGAALAWGRRMAGAPARHWILLAAGWGYGALDEWHQSFVPGRTPEPADFAADVLGVTVGYALFLFLARRLSSSPQERPRRS